MGDKSPKSKQKDKTQKLNHANSEADKKNDLIASKKISKIIKPPKKKK